MRRWHISDAVAGTAHLDQLLLDGWEPFGVVVEDGQERAVMPGQTLRQYEESGGGRKVCRVWLRRDAVSEPADPAKPSDAADRMRLLGPHH